MSELHLGKRLKSLLAEKGKTLSGYQRYMGFKSRQTVYDMYQRADMSVHAMVKTCQFLEMTASDFIGDYYPETFEPTNLDLRSVIESMNKRFGMLEDKMDLIIRRG